MEQFRVSRLSLLLQNPHQPRQHSLSTVDGQDANSSGNPISLAAVKLVGDTHLKCCIQMYFSLALTTKVSVRTVARSVEDSNGAEAWRLIHIIYAPDTQNRQYALMQKIMMPAKLWCGHAEGFEEPGLRALDVGEWERASGTALADAVKYTVMMNVAPIFLRNNLQLGAYANSAALRTALLHMVLLFPKLWSKSDRVSWKWNRCG